MLWVDEKRKNACARDQFMHHLEPLRAQFETEIGCAGDVTARPAQAGHEPDLDGVKAALENNGNRRGRGLRR